MARLPVYLASETDGIMKTFKTKVIRFARYGCTNRPFYRIVVADVKSEQKNPPLEQLGSYDECTNIQNEKLVTFNYERIQYWSSQGANMSRPFLELLGVAGVLPVHPRTYIKAWRNRRIK